MTCDSRRFATGRADERRQFHKDWGGACRAVGVEQSKTGQSKRAAWDQNA